MEDENRKEIKETDVVFIKKLNCEAVVFETEVIDLHTNEKKILVHDENKVFYLVNKDDIIFIDNFENMLKNAFKDNIDA